MRARERIAAHALTWHRVRSHIYHSMYAYFDRDNVALPGLARYFLKTSGEEREHAEKLMEYQNRRGGRVRMSHIPAPLSDFDDPSKGDALNVRDTQCRLVSAYHVISC